MKKTCRYFVSSSKCAINGEKPICKGCGYYEKENYIERILDKYGRN